MKHLKTCIVMAALLGGSAAMQAAPPPMSAMAWLIGGVWTADATKLGPGMQRIETRYQWSDNGSYIRFTTHFVTDKAELKTYDGNFFWDPAKNEIAMWYMDTKSAIVQGPVSVEGDRMRMLFRAPDFEGKVADMRVEVTRKTGDLYHWALAEKQGDGWKDLAGLDYQRK